MKVKLILLALLALVVGTSGPASGATISVINGVSIGTVNTVNGTNADLTTINGQSASCADPWKTLTGKTTYVRWDGDHSSGFDYACTSSGDSQSDTPFEPTSTSCSGDPGSAGNCGSIDALNEYFRWTSSASFADDEQGEMVIAFEYTADGNGYTYLANASYSNTEAIQIRLTSSEDIQFLWCDGSCHVLGFGIGFSPTQDIKYQIHIAWDISRCISGDGNCGIGTDGGEIAYRYRTESGGSWGSWGSWMYETDTLDYDVWPSTGEVNDTGIRPGSNVGYAAHVPIIDDFEITKDQPSSTGTGPDNW